MLDKSNLFKRVKGKLCGTQEHCVIDKRTEPDTAKELVENALDIGK